MREGLVVEGLAGVAAPALQVSVQPQPKSTAGKVPTAWSAETPPLPPLCLEATPATSPAPLPGALLPRTRGTRDGQTGNEAGQAAAPKAATLLAGLQQQGPEGDMSGGAGQPPLVFWGSNHRGVPGPSSAGQPGLRPWPQRPSGLGPKVLAQLLPARPDHQQVLVPFHEEVVPACPPEHLRGDSRQSATTMGWAQCPHPCPCPARGSWGLLSKAGSAHPRHILLLHKKTQLSMWALSLCWPVPASSPDPHCPRCHQQSLTDATSPISHTRSPAGTGRCG